MLVSALASCALFDKSEHVKIIGDYEVGWNDLVSNRCLRKSFQNCEGCFEVIIDEYVYAVGYNENFIIAKQQSGLDTTSTNYFIIDIYTNQKSSKTGIYGPLNLNEFESMRKKLGVSELLFDFNYSKNP
jgi:hypothetical protein